MTAANQNDENKPEARSNQPGRPVPGTGAVTKQKQNLYNKTHTLQSYHIDRIAGQKKKSAPVLLSSAVSSMEWKEREQRGIVQVYHRYSSAETSIMIVRFCFLFLYGI